MKTMENISVGHIEPGILRSHLRGISFTSTVKSSYAPKRLEKWYGYGSNLQSISEGRVEVEWKEDFPEWLQEIGQRFFPESNSALLCVGYLPSSDTSIDWHRDHGSFENDVVMVNLGRATFMLQDYDTGTHIYRLEDGDVVRFNSKLLHKSTQVSEVRQIVTLRKTRTQYTTKKLF